ncbi:MAG: MarR family winged helix-turn-helix transcriptional regulator [Hydrogenophaga sp.]|jgi:DNA-binding MarR family transcriptional regulator|nr:MarR family winged helix-turn-helix transcriptional regulator [Hydrogenophaga sp.]
MPETSIANALRRPRGPRKKSVSEVDLDLAEESTGAPEPSEVDTSYLESLLGYNARRAALAVIAVFLRRMEPYGLRPVDFSVVSVVAHNPGVTSRQICAALDILPPNLVGMVKSLHKRGLIVRKPHPTDRRAQGLHLSTAGQRLYREAQATATELEQKVAGRLSGEELQTLISLLHKVYRR